MGSCCSRSSSSRYSPDLCVYDTATPNRPLTETNPQLRAAIRQKYVRARRETSGWDSSLYATPSEEEAYKVNGRQRPMARWARGMSPPPTQKPLCSGALRHSM